MVLILIEAREMLNDLDCHTDRNVLEMQVCSPSNVPLIRFHFPGSLSKNAHAMMIKNSLAEFIENIARFSV
jgi:hypothetical protein